MTSKKPSGNWKSLLRQWIWHRSGCLCHGFTDSPPLPETVPLTAIAVEHPGARRPTGVPTTTTEGDLVEHRTTQPWPECHNQSMKHNASVNFNKKRNKAEKWILRCSQTQPSPDVTSVCVTVETPSTNRTGRVVNYVTHCVLWQHAQVMKFSDVYTYIWPHANCEFISKVSLPLFLLMV